MIRYLTYFFVLFTGQAYAQHTVSGRIVSSKQSVPIPGAILKTRLGQNIGSSDENGRYSITIGPTDSVLVIDHLGYVSKTVSVRSSLALIVLEPHENLLQEVTVSSGYQILSKERSTGSFSHVDNKTFNEQVSTDILSRLPAVANGLIADNSTNSSGKLMIRGLSTIRGPKAPLIVVDNFPYEGDISNINPNDVSDVTILKDAAAASIWGVRAGNGVIVITTKKGKFNQKVTIDVTANSTFLDKPNLSYIPQMASSDFIGVEEFIYNQGYYNSRINSSSKGPLTPVVEMLIQLKEGLIDSAQYLSQVNKLGSLDVRDQFEKYFYQTGLNQQYAVNVRGGSQIHSWGASAGYDHNNSTLDAGYNRVNLRFHHAWKPVDRLQVLAEAYYTQTSTSSGKPGYGDIGVSSYSLYPYAQFADEQGNPLPIAQKRQPFLNQLAVEGKLLDWNFYPLTDYQFTHDNQTGSDMLINSGINYRFLKSLSLDVKYQYERQQDNRENNREEASYFARDLTNKYSQPDPETGAIKYIVPAGGIVDRSSGILESHSVRAQINVDHAWSKHEINGILGGEIRDARNRSNTYRTYGFQGENLTSGFVDYTRQYPDFITGSQSYISDNSQVSDLTNRFVSVYGNGAYTYNNKYTVSASARRDATNLFGLKTNDKWNLLWSIGGSWDISKEAFFDVRAVSYLRLRLTHGFSGNIDPSMSAVSTIHYQGTNRNTSYPYARFDNYANPELKWETVGTTNAGIDFSLFSNRIDGSIEYYRKTGDNLFGADIVDPTAGIGSTILKNVAKMKGKGWDIQLNSTNIKSGFFQWQSQLNVSYNIDKVEEYYLTSYKGSNFVSERAISGVIGKPVYAVFSYAWAGLDPQTGDPRGYLNDEISTNYTQLTGNGTQLENLVYSGPVLPTWFGSFGNTFSYKGFSLTVRMTYKLGHYFRRSSIFYYALNSQSQGHADFADRWQKPGDEQYTDIPSMVYPVTSSRDNFYRSALPLVEKADHVRLQYVSLAYDFKKISIQKLAINGLTAFLNANNLGILWRANNKGIDPDYPAGNNTLTPSKTFTVGIRANL